MREILVFLITILSISPFSRAQSLNNEILGSTVFASRRTEVARNIPAGGCAVFFSGGLRSSGYDSPVPQYFSPDPDFFYLTGLDLPNSVLVLFPQAIELKEGTATELIFLPDTKQMPLSAMGFGYKGKFEKYSDNLILRPISQWRKFCIEILDADQIEKIQTLPASPTDFEIHSQNQQFQPPIKVFYGIIKPHFKVEPEIMLHYKQILETDSVKMDKLIKGISAWLSYFEHHTDPILKSFVGAKTKSDLKAVKREIREIKIDFTELERKMYELRMVKSGSEVREIKKAVEVLGHALKASAGIIAPGVPGYQIEAMARFKLLNDGARPARALQVISGASSPLFLYAQNDQTAKATDLVTLDFSARQNGYCAHIARTFPANGKFSPEFAAVFNKAADSHRKTMQACLPGTKPNGLCEKQKEALQAQLNAEVLSSGVHRSWRDDYAVVAIFPIGLDLFEGDNPQSIGEGMTFAVETSISVPLARKYNQLYRGLLIRFRDVVQVTANGVEVLSRDIPLSQAELEGWVGKNIDPQGN